jgi:nitrogen fixation NifU-like protein
MSSLYSKEIVKHFKHPRGIGRLKNPSGVGEAGNLLCGDIMRCYIKLKKNKVGKEVIEDIKMQVFGCVVAIANSSLLTTMVKGKTLDEALKIKKDDLLKKLGKVPPIKIHCSILAVDALHEAVYDYYKRNNLPIPPQLEKEHEKIVRTYKEVEKRFKEFVKFQKKMLEK